MPQGTLIRLYGVTAHFRDPRFNTGKIGSLPLNTLTCPPPCTIHGLLCAAKGGWVSPQELMLGWQMDYASKGSDLQTCWLPQRKDYVNSSRLQKTVMSPRDRQFLAFPCLSLLATSGVDSSWFRRPVNALCLGRSKDLIVKTTIEQIEWEEKPEGKIAGQCLPLGKAMGTLYSAPLYYEPGRIPVAFAPKTDASVRQDVRTNQSEPLAYLPLTNEFFYLWKFNSNA